MILLQQCQNRLVTSYQVSEHGELQSSKQLLCTERLSAVKPWQSIPAALALEALESTVLPKLPMTAGSTSSAQ